VKGKRLKVKGKRERIKGKINSTTERHGRAQIKEVGSGNAECGKTESVEVGKNRWWDVRG
jgi:hypothetical protein